MLDYACGGGIISRVRLPSFPSTTSNVATANIYTLQTQVLQPYFSQFIGVDLAEGMLAKYRETAVELGLSEQQMKAVRGNLLAPKVGPTDPPTSDEELSNFDLVAMCMALHHVDDLELAMKRLAEKLRPGGVLLVIDWAKMDNAPISASVGHTDNQNHNSQHQQQNYSHPGAHTMSHDSFTEEQIATLFQQADCDQSSFVLAKELSDVPPATSGKMQLFFARAMKK